MKQGDDYGIAPSDWMRWRSGCEVTSGLEIVEHTALQFTEHGNGFSVRRSESDDRRTLEQIQGWDERTLWITPVGGGNTDGRFDWERYSPTQKPGLHRVFAKCVETEDLVNFATQYGYLGLQTCALLGSGSPKGTPAIMGEPLRVWAYERARMEYLVAVWDAIRTTDHQFHLSRLVAVRDKYATVATPNPIGWVPDWPENAWYALAAEAGESDLRHGARNLLQCQLTKALSEHSTPSFTLRRGSQIRILPKTLYGVLHVHLLREAIGSSANIVLCPGCGEYFTQEHGRMRYCSQACRQKAYVQRKAGTEEANG